MQAACGDDAGGAEDVMRATKWAAARPMKRLDRFLCRLRGHPLQLHSFAFPMPDRLRRWWYCPCHARGLSWSESPEIPCNLALVHAKRAQRIGPSPGTGNLYTFGRDGWPLVDTP